MTPYLMIGAGIGLFFLMVGCFYIGDDRISEWRFSESRLKAITPDVLCTIGFIAFVGAGFLTFGGLIRLLDGL